MNPDDLSRHRDGLGDLFTYLWGVVEPHIGLIVAIPWVDEDVVEAEDISAAIEEWVDAGVPEPLIAYLSGAPIGSGRCIPANRPERRAFAVMRAIDYAARLVHPRSARAMPLIATRPPPPCVLDMAERLWVDGVMGASSDGTFATASKGPLTFPDTDDDPSGDRLDAQFANLTVFPLKVRHYEIRIRSVPPSLFAVRTAGSDPLRVGVAPIATGADDLIFEARSRGSKPFLDVQPRDPAILASRAADACEAFVRGGAHLVAMPELCVPGEALEATRARLRLCSSGAGPTLFVMGSGLSSERCGVTGLPFNESVVLDQTGSILWRQRKCNHFKMAASRMDQCSIDTIGRDKHTEDVATGDALEIRDLPGLGRVAVLICEDLEQPEPGGRVAEMLRLDWIVCPVLDMPLGLHRWTQQRANELSRRSGTRVVIACPAILDARAAAPEGKAAACALMLDAGAGRRFRLVPLDQFDGPGGSTLVHWLPEGWSVYGTQVQTVA